MHLHRLEVGQKLEHGAAFTLVVPVQVASPLEFQVQGLRFRVKGFGDLSLD
jgi:hypothetical protein